MAAEHIENIEKISQSEGLDVEKVSGDALSKGAPKPGQFEQVMAEKTLGTQEAQTQIEKLRRPNPLEAAEEAKRRMMNRRVVSSELVNQARDAIQKMEGVKSTLSTSKPELSRSVEGALERKLVHIDESLKIALSKVGADYAPPVNASKGLVAPIERFLGYLTNGQKQLGELSTHLEAIDSQGKTISPAGMIALQIKVGLITQQVEFFASLLNKALESTKTIMNVQV